MFKFSIWYRVFNKNIVNLINNLSKEFNTEPYFPHLTLQAQLDYIDSLSKYRSLKNIPTFIKTGIPYKTKNKNFYALQQDYIEKNSSNKKIYHVSLAYRVNKEFTDEELNLVKSMEIPNVINTNEIKIELWNCNSVNCLDWYKIR